MPDGISASPQPLAQSAASGVSSFITGAACASVAVAIWAGWLVVMRLGVTTTISVPDLAALRFAAAGLLLLPVVLRSGLAFNRLGFAGIIVLVLGGGVPYLLIVGIGLLFAPVAHAAVLTQGIVPLSVVLVSAVVLKERVTTVQKLGLDLIICGGLVIGGNAGGYRTVIVMPETQSQEKKDMLRLCGVDLRLVPAVPYANPMHYARYSGRLAEEIAKEEPNGAIWANQFDNLANRRGHYETTGPEIWAETEGKVDGFTCSMGTGGTLSGVGIALKERNRDVKIYLSDPMGSGFYNWYVHREWKPEGNSITEGIGNNHETGNIVGFAPDGQYQITDAEMLPVLFSLAQEEGLILGGSTGINVAGAIRLAKELGPGHTVVTILADSGARYQSNLFNPVFLKERSLPTPPWLER